MEHNWYEGKMGDHHGLIIEEETGRNIAVTYDKKDAPLIAAAPELYDALELLLCFDLDICDDTEEFQDLLNARDAARAIVAKAKGEK